jgi:hypothetical protein
MADTSVHGKVERWIVANELPRLCGEQFSRGRVPLTWGGVFECDAESSDSGIVACISTSCCRTATGRQAIGKFHKLRAGALYLLHTSGTRRRILAFTDPGMLEHFEKEPTRGRFPPQSAIELLLVDLPRDLAEELRVATSMASSEVSPRDRGLDAR